MTSWGFVCVILFRVFQCKRVRHAMCKWSTMWIWTSKSGCAQLVFRFVFLLPRQSCWPRSKFSQTACKMLQRDVSLKGGQLGDWFTSVNLLQSKFAHAKVDWLECWNASTQRVTRWRHHNSGINILSCLETLLGNSEFWHVLVIRQSTISYDSM